MRVGLFIPCFIDAFFPEVGIATLELLERFGLDVAYPLDQTCCGQPMANSGFEADAAGAEALFVRNFAGFDTIVGPSASCVHHIRNHLTAVPQTETVGEVRARTYELVEFLHDVLKAEAFPWARFPHKVGLHNSCSAVRGLGKATELSLNALTEVLQQMKAIGDLPCLRRALTRSLCIEASTVAADYLHFRTILEPTGRGRRRTIRQQVHHLTTLQVHDDRAVVGTLPPRPVINASHMDRAVIGPSPGMLLQAAQDRRVADRHAEPSHQPLRGPPTRYGQAAGRYPPSGRSGARTAPQDPAGAR